MSKLVKKQVHILQHGDVIYFVYRKHEPEQSDAGFEAADIDRPAQACSALPRDISIDPVLLVAPLAPQAPEEPQPSTSTYHLSTGISAMAAPALHTLSSGSGKASNKLAGLAKDMDCMEPEKKIRKISSVGPAKGTLRELLAKAPVEGPKTDKMEESLTCIICQDLLHDCVSLQPCMHTFCAACYSGWMERSALCPTCRCLVERIRKNHILNNLVEAYLAQNPEKCRSEEDLKSMDSRNKITQDMLQPRVERSFSDEEGSSDYLFDLSDNDSDTSDSGQAYGMCRQCPGYSKEVSQVLWAGGLMAPPPPPSMPPVSATAMPAPEEGPGRPPGEAGPSSSTESPSASQEYRCPPHGSHVVCSCCLQPMPDRHAELSTQQCVACHRPFCHVYWGCQRIGCQGCLARFSELNLADKCLDGVLNNNNHESEILRSYLASRGLTWRDILQEGLQGLQQGTYYISDYRINPNATVCLCCGLQAFKELAFKYRQNIPASELPAAVTSRPDCYWGRNCRTQVKAHHAMKFNHICEQTRFKS
ncbi:E3 ubiquitin-protein ligase CHFR [Aplochiton taeniatus]